MCLITTVPERLAIMARDASEDIVFCDWYWRTSIDDILRPAVVVESPGEGDYQPSGAGVENAVTETYTLTIMGNNYGQGAEHEAERQLRQITKDVVDYFIVRTQLQFSNLRDLEDAPLQGLPGVRWARIRRAPATIMGVSGNGEGESRFWGCQLTITVYETIEANEVLIPNLG